MKRICLLLRLGCVLILFSTAQRARAAEHPLEPLSAQEIRSAFEIVQARFHEDAALPHEPLRFPIVALAEPAKAFVLSWSPGKAFARHALLHVLHYPSNQLWVAEVDLALKRIVRLEAQPIGTQAAI